MTLRFTALAVADLTQARDRYREVDDELGRRYLDQLDLVMDRLAAFPNGAPPVDGFVGVRRARMRRFPYGVFSRVDETGILILRVLHTRRDAIDID